jgi:tetratricopeptide (TPR) repeat protein
LFNANIAHVHYCNLPLWEKEDIEEFFNYCFKSDINKENLAKIVEYSASPFELLENINLLISQRFFYKNSPNNTWICEEIDESVLAMNFSAKTRTRYEKLDGSLKKVLNKASLLGCKFDCLTYENIFSVKQARLIFMQIEKISALIHEEAIKKFSFSSERAQEEIKNVIEEINLLEWCKILGNYYYSNASNSNLLKPQRATYLEKAAQYFFNCKEYELCMRCENELIKILIEMECYNNAVHHLKNLENLIKKTRINEHLLPTYYYYLCCCYLSLAGLQESFEYFTKYKKLCPTKDQNKYEHIYLEGYLQYNLSNMPKAFELFNAAYIDIMEVFGKSLYDNKKDVDWNNACKILEVFASVCDLMGDRGLSDKRRDNVYNNALDISKRFGLKERHNSILRKVNMVHKGEIAVSLMTPAKAYFSENNALEHAMTMHNIAMEYIYMHGKLEEAYVEIKKSKDIFDKIGSNWAMQNRNILGIYHCHKLNYREALSEFNKMKIGDSYCHLVILINRINCFRKLKMHNEEIAATKEARAINAQSNNQIGYIEGALLVQEAYSLMEKGDKGSDMLAIKLLDKYFENLSCDRTEQVQSIMLTLQTLKEKRGIPISPENLIDINCINPIVKFLYDERLYLCEILFFE